MLSQSPKLLAGTRKNLSLHGIYLFPIVLISLSTGLTRG